MKRWYQVDVELIAATETHYVVEAESKNEATTLAMDQARTEFAAGILVADDLEEVIVRSVTPFPKE